MNLQTLAKPEKRVSAPKSRLAGHQRAVWATRPVKCQLIFVVMTVGIDPMEALA